MSNPAIEIHGMDPKVHYGLTLVPPSMKVLGARINGRFLTATVLNRLVKLGHCRFVGPGNGWIQAVDPDDEGTP